MFDVILRGDPVPKARPRVTKTGHAFTPKATREAERAVAVLCQAAGLRPHGGPLIVHLDFVRATKRRVDIDNLIKLIFDALNGVGWRDDSQIRELHVTLDIGRPPGQTRIRISELTEMSLFAGNAAALE